MAQGWKVLYQDTRPDVRTNGQLINVRIVHFRITDGPATGHEDQVEILDQPGYSEQVPALIQAKVDEIQSVAGL